ncbi:acyl transferase/acyl hydrolase/lysophospholipase [Ilyonectria sp. MPI-CAGE-AT-0026]|nr:acyl transferase/acyl hydrolase/lysophospholipase [Ilyonectria sp. MPI-CAGE-AT-0026]
MAHSAGPLRVLSLDGGGIRGVSSLLILEDIMEKLREKRGLDRVPRPCDHFDLIGGTSTGGIIAIMLGRLGMTVDQCIRAYIKVAQKAFTPKRTSILPAPPSGNFSAKALEAAIKQTVREFCTAPGCIAQREQGQPTIDTCEHDELDFRDSSCTKTVVLAITKDNVDAPPTLFTTYDQSARLNGSKIWQVARATSAATTFFKSIKIGRDGVEYIDAGFGHNNPCDVLIQEAQRQFPNRTDLQVLSIGTGLGDVVTINNTRKSILKALKKMATSSKKVAFNLKSRFGDTNQYYRFNVDVGLKDITLSDWERSSTISSHTSNYLRENEMEIRKFVDAFSGVAPVNPLTQPVAELSQETNRVVHHIPFHRNARFVGRQKVTDKLTQLLFTQTDTRRVAIVGLGGMGKTQVALQFAHWVKENKPDHSVLWVPALSNASFEQACTEIKKKLAIPNIDEEPKEAIRRHLSLEEAGKWLLIVDNADDMDILYGSSQQPFGIHHYLPQSEHGRVLFTTRSQEVAVRVAGGDVIELQEMSREESKSVLEKSLVHKNQLQDEEAVTKLLEELAYLPLAIAQAAAYVSINKVPISEYLRLCQNTNGDMIELLSSKFHDSTHYNSSQNAVATTWSISFTQIHNNDKSAATLLSFISHIEPKAIPRWILPTMESEQQLTKAIGTLCGYGFLNGREDGETFEMHRLVHLATRVWTDAQSTTNSTAQDAAKQLAKVFPSSNWRNRELWQQCLPHALRVLQASEKTDDVNLCSLGIYVGRCLRADRRIKEAVNILECVVDWDSTLKPKCGHQLDPKYELAVAYKEDKQAKRAIQLLEDAVSIQANTPATKHRDRLKLQHHLARAYAKNGQTEEAVKLLQDIALIEENTLSTEHPSRLASQHQLAKAYAKTGRIEEAVKLLEDVVSKWANTTETEHPYRIASQLQLAKAYSKTGRIEEAVKLFEHVVSIQANTLTTEHPDRLKSQQELAWAYKEVGRTEEAENLMEQVVAIRNKILPRDGSSRLRSERVL